jgi:hypothetical protein
MKDNKNELNKTIWHNFFTRSANAFIFDLNDKMRDLKQFSDEELLSLAAICNNIAVKGLVFKEELEKRVKLS